MSWYSDWFNEDYLALYPHRNQEEADRQVEGLLNLLGLTEGRVLDLGCGAGRHALKLAQSGFDVVGLDLSAHLLDKAPQHPNIEYVKRDMRNLSDLGQFDLVTSFFTSFGYFSDPREDQKVLDNIAPILNGYFALDIMQPNYVKAHLKKDDPNQKRRIEGNLVIKEITLDNRHYEERVRLYEQDEMIAMFKAAKIKPLHVYADFDGSPWSPTSPRQLFIGSTR